MCRGCCSVRKGRGGRVENGGRGPTWPGRGPPKLHRGPRNAESLRAGTKRRGKTTGNVWATDAWLSRTAGGPRPDQAGPLGLKIIMLKKCYFEGFPTVPQHGHSRAGGLVPVRVNPYLYNEGRWIPVFTGMTPFLIPRHCHSRVRVPSMISNVLCSTRSSRP